MTPHRIFARLNIASKMLLGYTMLVVLTVVVVVYVLINSSGSQHEQRRNKIDIRIQESADKMLDALLAQDTYEKRYLILRRDPSDPDVIYIGTGEISLLFPAADRNAGCQGVVRNGDPEID